ncbi:hypothetical protein ACJBU6_02604 [Exserohilum turcicum]
MVISSLTNPPRTTRIRHNYILHTTLLHPVPLHKHSKRIHTNTTACAMPSRFNLHDALPQTRCAGRGGRVRVPFEHGPPQHMRHDEGCCPFASQPNGPNERPCIYYNYVYMSM